MGQNLLNQSHCSIFKLTKFLEQNDEKVWFVACWCRFMEIKSQLKNIDVDLVKIGCGHSGLKALKLSLSQGMNEWACVEKNSGNLKVTLIIFTLSWSEMGMALGL